MKKLLTIASALILTAVISGCSNNSSFSNMFSSWTDSANAAVADQTKSMNEIQAEAQKMNEKALQSQIDSYKSAITSKQSELTDCQNQLKQMAADQMNSDKVVSLKSKIANLTASLDDMNKKLQVFVDQLKAIQK